MPETLPARTPGIYRILCSESGHVYIGSSVNVQRRCKEHLRALRRGCHYSSHLQRAWDKYGEVAFRFDLVEAVPAGELLLREQVWLDQTQCYDRQKGYNAARCAEAPARGATVSVETRRKLSEALEGRTIPAEARANMAVAQKLRMQRADERQTAGSARRGCVVSKSTRQKMAVARQEAWDSPEYRERLSAILTAPEYRERLSVAGKAAWVIRKQKQQEAAHELA